jgi:uncharacterized protein YodC (DUF2158 family)
LKQLAFAVVREGAVGGRLVEEVFIMADELKVGDVVQLKSGGPKMTIEGIDAYGLENYKQAICVWFEKSKRETHVFELTSLQKVV